MTEENRPALLIARARSRRGISRYRVSARLDEAPEVFNCYRFMQWVWLGIGIHLPDHQIRWSGAYDVPAHAVQSADLVFAPLLNRTLSNDDFGHVGIATGEGTVVHATKRRNTVVEDAFEAFIARGCLGVRRVIVSHSQLAAE